MKQRRHTPEQVIRKLAEGEKLLAQGKSVEDVSRHLEITESTWHRWRNQYGGMKADDAKELKGLCRENQRLKKIVADQALDIDMLKEAEPGKLLTSDCRRRAVVGLQEQFGVSERRACAVVGQPRSTQRLPTPVPPDEELALRAFLRDFSRRRPRTPAGGPTTSASTAPGVKRARVCPIRPNVVWALDFQFDQTSDARMLKLLNVIDEYSRECLAIDTERSIDADGVVACLECLVAQRGAPTYVRFDHGPEFIAYAVADWCRFNSTDTVFIDPGSPWQNAWIESFNGRLRDEFLNGQRFDSLPEAQVLLEDWRIDYNINRPHSAHGWLTPVEFVEAWLHQQQLMLA